MSKRRELLIRLLLISVIICCSIHTSCGQENDTVNIPPHSSLPAKSDFSQEDILNHAQRSLDRSIDLFNTVATVMGVFGALIALIIMIGGAFGYYEISRFKELNNEAEKNVQETANKANEVTEIVTEVKKLVSDAKPVFERLEKIDKNAENVLYPYREEVKHVPSLLATPSEPFPEDKKEILEEYGRKMGDLEAFGVPLKSEDYLNRGVDLYQREEYELALKAFDKAIELKPDFAEAWNSKGVILSNLGRYDEALKAFDKAMELKQEFDFAWLNKGAALDNLGRYDEALKAFDKVIELKPDFAKGWYNKGVALGNLGRYDEALKAYDKAIELKPDYAEAWYNKACAYSRKGDKENALKCLSKAMDLKSKYKEMAKSDDAFKNLWDDEDFKRIVS